MTEFNIIPEVKNPPKWINSGGGVIVNPSQRTVDENDTPMFEFDVYPGYQVAKIKTWPVASGGGSVLIGSVLIGEGSQALAPWAWLDNSGFMSHIHGCFFDVESVDDDVGTTVLETLVADHAFDPLVYVHAYEPKNVIPMGWGGLPALDIPEGWCRVTYRWEAYGTNFWAEPRSTVPYIFRVPEVGRELTIDAVALASGDLPMSDLPRITTTTTHGLLEGQRVMISGTGTSLDDAEGWYVYSVHNWDCYPDSTEQYFNLRNDDLGYPDWTETGSGGTLTTLADDLLHVAHLGSIWDNKGCFVVPHDGYGGIW